MVDTPKDDFADIPQSEPEVVRDERVDDGREKVVLADYLGRTFHRAGQHPEQLAVPGYKDLVTAVVRLEVLAVEQLRMDSRDTSSDLRKRFCHDRPRPGSSPVHDRLEEERKGRHSVRGCRRYRCGLHQRQQRLGRVGGDEVGDWSVPPLPPFLLLATLPTHWHSLVSNTRLYQ